MCGLLVELDAIFLSLEVGETPARSVRGANEDFRCLKITGPSYRRARRNNTELERDDPTHPC